MTKEAFLAELKNGLSGLPENEIEERLSFYREMIDDRMEEGLSENDAVAAPGSVSEIVARILEENKGDSPAVREPEPPKRRPRGWEIVLIVLGFPVWFALLTAAFAVALALCAALWAVVLALWVADAALLIAAAGAIAGAVVLFVQGQTGPGIAAVGAALLCAGLSIFLFFGCTAATKGAARLTRAAAAGIGKLFKRKERNA